MKFLFSLLLLVFIINCSQAQVTSRIDSILLEMEEIPSEEKMDAWKSWYLNAGKEDLPNLLVLLDHAYNDAEEIVGRDSAIIWKFFRQSYFVSKFQGQGQGNISTKILDDMKVTADSLSAIKGSAHYTLVEWYYRSVSYTHLTLPTIYSV